MARIVRGHWCRCFRIFALDGTAVRAFRQDGAELWTVDAGVAVTQLASDLRGGVVVRTEESNGQPRLRMIDADGHLSSGPAAGAGEFALHPDGPAYQITVDAGVAYLVGEDVGRGAGPRVALPTGIETFCAGGSPEAPEDCSDAPRAFGVGTPTVVDDGSVVVPVVTGRRRVFASPPSYDPERFTPELSLLFLPTGWLHECSSDPRCRILNVRSVAPFKILNGHGGVVGWTTVDTNNGAHSARRR